MSIEFFWSYHKSIDWTVVGFLLHQKRDWNKVPKTDFHTELTETSNLIFCVATRFVSPIKVSVGNPTVLVQDSTEKFLIWFLYQIFDVQESTECCVLNQLGFQNHVSPLVEAWFLPSRSQSETIILNRRLGWKYVNFLPCNRNLIRFFVASETWLKQSSKNWFSYWVDWIFKLDILRSYPFRFSHQSVSRKPYSGSAGFDWESFNLIPVSKYWCAKTHWRYLVLNHLDFQNDVSPLIEAWFLPSRSRSKDSFLS